MKQSYLEGLSVVTPMVRTMGTCLISLCWLSMALVALYSPIAASQENTTTFPNLLECEDDVLPLLIQQAQLTRTNLLQILGDQRSALQNIESWFNEKLTTPATLELVKAVDQAQHELEAFEYLCSAATEVEGSRDTSPSSQTLIAFVEQYKKKFSVTDTEAYCRDAKAHRVSHQKDVETSTAMILKLRENRIHADPVLQIQRQGLQRSWAHHKHGLQLVLLDNPQERMKVIRILQRRFQSLPKAPSEASSSPEWMAAVRRVCGPHHQPCPSEVLEELRQIRNLEWQSYRSRAVWMLSRMTYKDLTDLKQHFITDRPEGVAKAGGEEEEDDDESRNFITRQKNFYDCINGKQGLDEVDGKMPTNSFHGNRIKLTSSIDIFDDPDPLFAENDSVMRSRIVERRVLQEDLEHALANHADPTGSKIPQDRKWETYHQLRQHRLEMELRHRRCALGLFREILDSSNLVRRYTDTISVVVHEEEMISQLALLPSQSDGPFQIAVFQLFHSVSDLYQQEAMIEEDILADMNIEEWAKQHQAAGAAPHINSDPLLSSWARHALSRFALQFCLKSPSSSSNRTAAATRATPFAADFPLFAVTMLECETLLLSAVAEESLSENMFLEMMNFDGVKAVELSNTRLMIDLLHQLIADYQRTHFELLAQNPHDLNWILSQWMSTTVTNMKQARKDLGLKEAAWSSEVETSVAAVVDSGKAAWSGTVDRAVMWWSLIEQISIRDAGYQLPEGFLLEMGFLQWCRVESALRLLQDVVSNEEGSSRPEPSASASSESPPPPPGPRSQSLLWETLNAEQASNFETVLSTITHSDPESIEKSVLELKNHSIFLTDPRAGMTRGFSETKPSPVQRLLAQAWWNVDRYVYDLAFVYRWRFFYLQAAAAGKSDVIDFLERTRYAAMENAHNTAETATPTEATPEEVEDESFDPLYQSMVVACLHVPLRDATIHRKEQAVFNIPSKPTPCPPETTLLFGRLRDMEYQYTRVRALAAALDLEDSELTDLHTSVQGFCPALANPGFAMSGAKSSTEVDSEAPPKPEDLTAPHLKLSALLLLEETAANARQGTLEKVALEKVLDAEVVEQLQAALTGPSGSWERTLAQWFGVSTQEASELLQKYLDLTQDSATLFRAESPEGWLYSNLWGAKAYQSDCTILEGDLRLAIQLSSVATQQQETLAGTNMMQTLDFTIGVTLSEMYRELSLLRAQLGLTTSLMENVPKQRDSIRSPAMQLRNLLIVGHRKRQALCQLSNEPFSSIQSSKTYPQLCDEVGSFCEIGYVKLQSSYDRAVKYTSLVEEQNVPTSPTLAMLVGVVIRRIKGLDTTKRSAMMNHVSESESIARTRVTFRNLGVNVAHWLWNFAARQKKGTSSLFYTVFETIQIGYAWNQLRQQLFSEMSITQVKPQVFIGKYYKRLQHNLRQKSRELFDKDGTNVLQQDFPSSRDRIQGDSAAAEGANEDEDEDEGEDDDDDDEEEDEAIYSISSQESKAYSRDANRDYKTGNSEGKLEATESHDTTLHKTVSDARRKSRIAVLVLLGCLAAAVVLFALWSLYQRSNSPPSGLRSMHLDEYGYQSILNETLVAMK